MAQYNARRYGRGFSVIEILVGVAIGMVGLLSMFQMLSLWQTRAQTVAAGGDSQISGNIGLYNIERDLRLAGMGFNVADAPVMGCNVTAHDHTLGRDFNFRMAPVEITQGTNNGADSIAVLYGNSSFSADTKDFTRGTATTKTTKSRTGLQLGDLVVVTDSGNIGNGSANCDLVEVNKNNDPDSLTIGHDTNTYTSFYTGTATTPRFNIGAGTGVTYNTGHLFDLGPGPQRNVWSLTNNRTLTWFDDLHSTTAQDVIDGVANLQAEYGVDADGNNTITDGSGGTPDEWVTAVPADWTQVRAIRVAILVRSPQYERTMVTPAAPTWSASVAGAHATAHPESQFLMKDLDGSPRAAGTADSSNTNDWRHYRYRVFEKVIPLRNMIWGTAP